MTCPAVTCGDSFWKGKVISEVGRVKYLAVAKRGQNGCAFR